MKILLFALLGAVVNAEPQWPSRCLITTSNGSITGHAAEEKNHVCEWLGIPYASPPVGQLRFAPPVHKPIQGPLIASKYGFDCPQNQAAFFAYPNATPQYARVYANFVNQANHTQSEDCLTLNIWSKSSSSPKPVMIFIHGGRYSAGTSNTPYYDGQFLANNQDVVFVTFNFRMNIFGFPGAPEGTQNLGFLDQYAAVSWVYKHIAAFGGDADRITIVGQSSGAQAVGNWAYAFKDKPLIAGSISHSGNAFSFPANSMELAAKNWHNAAHPTPPPPPFPVCAPQISPSNPSSPPQDAFPHPRPPSQPAPSPPFQITIDNTTAFPPSTYTSFLSSGAFAPIPYLQIDNAHESGFYRISALAAGRRPSEAEWKDFEDSTFTCPLAMEAKGRGIKGVATWRARYAADWENLRLYNGDGNGTSGSGAYHGVEMNMVIGNAEGVSGIGSTGEEERLSGVMQGAWAAFARDPAHVLENFGWPKYQEGEDTFIRIGQDNTASVEFVDTREYNSVCAGLGLDF